MPGTGGGEITAKASIYLETTIPSYLAAFPSRDIVVAAHQQITHDWWVHERHRFELFISETVLAECQLGDPEAAQRRLSYLSGLPVLSMDDSVLELAKVYLEALSIPARSGLDALHLACAVSHEIDYVLTWNCKHLAHGEIRRALQKINLQKGLFIPAIVTPEELMERSE